MIAKKMQTLSHFPPEALELCLCGPDVGAKLRGLWQMARGVRKKK